MDRYFHENFVIAKCYNFHWAISKEDTDLIITYILHIPDQPDITIITIIKY